MRRLGFLLTGLATPPGTGPPLLRDAQWLTHQHGRLPS